MVGEQTYRCAERHPHDGSHKKGVAVMGWGHGLVESVWNNPKERERIIKGVLRDIFSDLAQDKPSEEDRRQMLGALIQLYGTMARYDIGDAPSEMTVEGLKKSITNSVDSVCFSISDMAKEAAIDVGFVEK